MTQSESAETPPGGQYSLIASRLHLAVFLWIQMFAALAGGSTLRHVLAAPDEATYHSRLATLYCLTIAWEFALVTYLWFGMRKTRTSLGSLIGGKWRSIWSPLKDVGFGLLFWVLWMVAATICGKVLAVEHRPTRDVLAMLPRTQLELGLWIAMSLVAGFCEEIMFRGYLQRQFLAISKRTSVAVIAQGLMFGLVHSYQGVYAVVMISIMGILFGVLAAWRKSLRPGMIAHAWQDLLVGVAMYLMYAYHMTR
jgi:membrane protease YdiL (CAAX protease family)